MLDYVRIYDFKLIPDRFFKAKGANYNMKFIRGAGTDLPSTSNNHAVYALVNNDQVVSGLLWLSYNIATNSLRINIYSVDEQYQDKTNMQKAIEFITTNHNLDSFDRVDMATTRVKAFEKYGFRNTGIANMEIELWASQTQKYNKPHSLTASNEMRKRA